MQNKSTFNSLWSGESAMDSERTKKKRIHALLVDPEEEILQDLLETFQEVDYFTDVAQKGMDAINMAKEFFYNVIMVEMDLPDMKGLDFLKMIKGIHPDTTVIFITAKPSLENSVDALNSGASAYLVKPLQKEQMMQQISDALEKQRNILETRELLFTERKKREFYQYLSIRDGLTDLYNHRHFHELLNQEMAPAVRYNQPLSLLMIDIDNFKKFNDSYGHPAGDLVLIQIASLLRENCRRLDHVCRYGGEEFGIITPETSGKNATRLSRRLVSKVREAKIQVYDSSIEEKVTISVGLASFPTDAKNKDDLIIKADQFLLQAKKAGKDCFYPPSP
jgi:two-component system, cell cycle response regulator